MAALFARYAARCTPKLELVELELPARDLKTDDLKGKEAELLLKHWPTAGTVIACDERGRPFSSTGFSNAIDGWTVARGPQLTFVIGGADGLHGQILDKAHATLSLGLATWPHLLVRVLLAEQLYRAHTIRAGHPYHRE